MGTMIAFVRNQAAIAAGNEPNVFDWEKAARLIVERKPHEARAGLSGDWEYTGGPIFANGAPVPREDTYVYLASNWAIPELELDGELMDCYRKKSEVPGWAADTYWPPEALAIIGRTEV